MSESGLPVNGERMIGRALDIDPAPEFEEMLRLRKERHAETGNPAHLDGPEHVIVGGRAEGKTRLALKWLNDAPEGVERVLIVASGYEAEALNEQAGFPRRSPRIISFRSLRHKGPRAGVEYGIDESVRILSDLLGLKGTPRLVTVGHAEPWQTGTRNVLPKLKKAAGRNGPSSKDP
jgi:hypothetical protein